MEQILSRVFTEYAAAVLLLESPLLGCPRYDVLVGSYGKALTRGIRFSEESPRVCHEALEWAVSWKGPRAVDLFFESDASQPGTALTAVQCRHENQPDAVRAFFEAIGESWRWPLYSAVAEKLPPGWIPQIAGAFMGRPGAPTRLELCPTEDALSRIARNASSIRDAFDAAGFRA